MEYTEALKIGQNVISYISEYCERIILVGSLRRECSFCSDIDILCMPKNIQRVKMKLEEISNAVLNMGNYKCCIMYSGEQVDINMVYKDNSWATAMAHHTGSKEENIRLRVVAKKLGYKLSQHGLFLGDDSIDIDSEEQLYCELNLDYKEPKER